jgi:hypothetical protein
MRKALIILNLLAGLLILPVRDVFNMQAHGVLASRTRELVKSGEISSKTQSELIDMLKPIYLDDINTYICIPVIVVCGLNVLLALGLRKRPKTETA